MLFLGNSPDLFDCFLFAAKPFHDSVDRGITALDRLPALEIAFALELNVRDQHPNVTFFGGGRFSISLVERPRLDGSHGFVGEYWTWLPNHQHCGQQTSEGAS